MSTRSAWLMVLFTSSIRLYFPLLSTTEKGCWNPQIWLWICLFLLLCFLFHIFWSFYQEEHIFLLVLKETRSYRTRLCLWTTSKFKLLTRRGLIGLASLYVVYGAVQSSAASTPHKLLSRLWELLYD